jgi:hypothetical protein
MKIRLRSALGAATMRWPLARYGRVTIVPSGAPAVGALPYTAKSVLQGFGPE